MEEVDKNAIVRGIIDQAISALEAIGLSHEDALGMLAAQAINGMKDKLSLALTAQTLRYVESGYLPPTH